MSDASNDPRCPECGGKIGQTATYCMHCSADLTDELEAADADDDWTWDSAETESPSGERQPSASPSSEVTTSQSPSTASTSGTDESLLDPDGIVDDTLTVVVGILAGVVIGLLGTVVMLALTGSGWALVFGFVTWLGATAYLVRRRTVQEAISKGGYGLAIVLLTVPLIALSPVASVDGGLEERGGLLVALLVFVAVPAGIAAAVGWIAGRFVPAGERGSEG